MLLRYITIKKLSSGHFGTTWMVRHNSGTNHFVLKKIEVINLSRLFFLYLLIHLVSFVAFCSLTEWTTGMSLWQINLEEYLGRRQRTIALLKHLTMKMISVLFLYLREFLYSIWYTIRLWLTVFIMGSDWWMWMKQTYIDREAMKDSIFQLVCVFT